MTAPRGENGPEHRTVALTLDSDPQLLIHFLSHILEHPEEVLPASEIAEYERCQQSIVNARRYANANEGNIYIP